MRRTPSVGSRLLVPAFGMLMLGCSVVAVAQGPAYHLGRPPTEKELHPADAAIRPDGDGLPPGSGTVKQGAVVYMVRGCAGCHGPTGTEGPAAPVIASPGRRARAWPFAPLIWSWINRAMPLNQEGYLTPNEVYSLTAYILHGNGIIQESDVMDATTLAQVRMPSRDTYVPPPFSEWKAGQGR